MQFSGDEFAKLKLEGLMARCRSKRSAELKR